MSKHKKEIPAEKIALLAEKGFKNVKLTEDEKKLLLEEGMGEIYNTLTFSEESISKLDAETLNILMARFYPEEKSIDTETPVSKEIDKLWLRFSENVIETTRSFVDWKAGSPAFTYRGSAENCVSFYKEVGKLTVHLEILQREDRLADINVRLTDETRRDRSSFEVELFKDQRCIETVNTTKDSIALFSAIAIDNYKLKISDRKGEITSFSIRMER